jgi:formylglycine-generating enzyme required for sulfatase activity
VIVRNIATTAALAVALGAGCGGTVTRGGGANKDSGADVSVSVQTGGAPAEGGAGGAGGTGGSRVRDAGSNDGAAGKDGATSRSTIPSCRGLADDCGPSSNESCCTSKLVTGGEFFRHSDVTTFTSQDSPFTVNDFWLDRFEVSVGRFRKFVAQWNAGWRPAAGDGKHTLLLKDGGAEDAGPGDTGWDVGWEKLAAPIDATLECEPEFGKYTWTRSPGANENRPINCLNWYQAYAFCIWDGGFLPTDEEANYAASGGSEQRVYPWSSPASSSTIDCSYANYQGDLGNGAAYCVGSASDGGPGGATNDVGSESPRGDGRYGQTDLGGNVAELVLERWTTGGSFSDTASILRSSNREPGVGRGSDIGVRCARPGPNAGAERVVVECEGKHAGDVVCQGLDRVRCGTNLNTTTPMGTCAAGTESCVDGACIPCAAGKANCDANATDCETDLTSTSTCGTTCANTVTCSDVNGMASCKDGICGISSCTAGAADCKGTNDGCETVLVSSASCGTTCANKVACTWPTPACVAAECTPPPSCDGLATNCGSSSNESCCASPLVPGGTFFRSYDGVTKELYADYTKKDSPATVSDFRLDKFEITVGRFRKFVAAWNGGWRPLTGNGKHQHLAGGSGLLDASGSYEQGWDASWTKSVSPTDAHLHCGGSSSTSPWTPSAGANENRPVSCLNWYEAYAFCIWDGGFLPSEAEWNYAASGGSEQRVYPWSSPATSTAIDCSYANGYLRTDGNGGIGSCTDPIHPNDVGSYSPKGDGKYGQADLGGNLTEWNLDWIDFTVPYSTPCSDCSSLTRTAEGYRGVRGGAFEDGSEHMTASYRDGHAPTDRLERAGARCARAP